MIKNQSQPVFGKIFLAGNPNVGKSTLFNYLTSSKVHTGNWAGKTVSLSEGYGIHKGKNYLICDLPGISSLSCPDAEELSAFDAIIHGDYDCLVIVGDATNLSRSLCLALRILELKSNCVLCINLYDEAQKQGIFIDADALSFILGIPVVLCSAQRKKGIEKLYDECEHICQGRDFSPFFPLYNTETEDFLQSMPYDRKEAMLKTYSSPEIVPDFIKQKISLKISETAHKIANTVTKTEKSKTFALFTDRIICSPFLSIPIMLIFLSVILYITIIGANYPSNMLSSLFSFLGNKLNNLFSVLHIAPFFKGIIIDGIYQTSATVISVMLPPMAIFFPLFTLLEESGILPRIAFNLDPTFKKCGTNGKHALCVCMGLGCNCVGVSNSAIIPSRNGRLISIITNSITPCNGRFGALTAAISLFAVNKTVSALSLSLVLVFSFALTLISSFILSKTILPTKNESFILELPPYRKPRIIRVLISAIKDKTLHITLRALSVASPMGAIIYTLGYFNILSPIARVLNPLGNLMGLDGIVLLSFILSLPANETVLPIAAMLYGASSHSQVLSQVLTSSGWDFTFCVSFIIFTLCHWPCATALLTIKNETKSLKMTLLSFIIPLVLGFLLCSCANLFFSFFAV